MFGFLKQDKTKKLEKEYAKILEKAVDAQRNGNIALYSKLMFESDKLLKEIDAIKENK